MNHTRPGRTIIVQTSDVQDNWMHPQTPERKKRIQERMKAAAANSKKMRNELNRQGQFVKRGTRVIMKGNSVVLVTGSQVEAIKKAKQLATKPRRRTL